MLEAVSPPAGITTVSVLVHGPLALVEKTPWGELELRLTATVLGVLWSTPASRVRRTIGPEGLPALSACGGLAQASASRPQYVNVFQPSLSHAPAITLRHHRFCPSGPQEPTPWSPACPFSALKWRSA